MKKTVILFLAILMPCLAIYSEPIDIRKTTNEPLTGPRTGTPSVSADIESGIITIDINRYMGSVSVRINNEEGEPLVVNTSSINGHTSFETTVSQLPEGSYTLVVELNDGSTYMGCFEVI